MRSDHFLRKVTYELKWHHPVLSESYLHFRNDLKRQKLNTRKKNLSFQFFGKEYKGREKMLFQSSFPMFVCLLFGFFSHNSLNFIRFLEMLLIICHHINILRPREASQ